MLTMKSKFNMKLFRKLLFFFLEVDILLTAHHPVFFSPFNSRVL